MIQTFSLHVRSSWLIAVLTLTQGFFPLSEAVAASADLIKYRDAPWQYLQTIVGLGPRNPGSPGHQKVRKYILEIGKKFADEVVTQPFTHQASNGETLSLINIELRFGSGGPPVLIGAHYDTRPFSDEETDPAMRALPVPGANDGGSGTAVLLALARFLHDHKPKKPVRLVFFDGEDYGAKGSFEYLLGSIHYARLLQKSDKNAWPFCVLVVDMIGDKDLQVYREGYSVESAPWLVEMIDHVAHQMNSFPQFKESTKYTMLDDHYPFILRDIPSVLLIDFDYPPWHTQADTLDKCSLESLYTVFSVVTGTLNKLQTLH